MLADLSSSRSVLSLLPLPAALLVALAFIVFKRRPRRKTKIRTAFRALFTTRIWFSPSALLDFKYALAGGLIFSSVIAYATTTGMEMSKLTYTHLSRILGTPHSTAHSSAYCDIAMTLILYMAYELAYWIDHYLSHKIPFLWEFHKVHHSATVLTPFTNWRVHPVDTIVFVNITAVVVGAAHGIIYYIMGQKVSVATISYTNVIILFYMALYGHLQHSQLWIPFTGPAGRIFLSPAHHQIHHSSNPLHFDKNFGAALAIFDWVFGTLHLPSKQKENLTLGTHGDQHLKRLIASTFYPFLHAWKHIRNAFGRPSRPEGLTRTALTALALRSAVQRPFGSLSKR